MWLRTGDAVVGGEDVVDGWRQCGRLSEDFVDDEGRIDGPCARGSAGSTDKRVDRYHTKGLNGLSILRPMEGHRAEKGIMGTKTSPEDHQVLSGDTIVSLAQTQR